MNLFSLTLAVVVGSWLAIPDGEWSPAPEQVSELRISLEPYVKQQALTQHLQLPKWQNYTFQFQGQVDAGQKVIFVVHLTIAWVKDNLSTLSWPGNERWKAKNCTGTCWG